MIFESGFTISDDYLSNVDPILVRDEIMSLLVAGRDTVRNTTAISVIHFFLKKTFEHS